MSPCLSDGPRWSRHPTAQRWTQQHLGVLEIWYLAQNCDVTTGHVGFMSEKLEHLIGTRRSFSILAICWLQLDHPMEPWQSFKTGQQGSARHQVSAGLDSKVRSSPGAGQALKRAWNAWGRRIWTWRHWDGLRVMIDVPRLAETKLARRWQIEMVLDVFCSSILSCFIMPSLIAGAVYKELCSKLPNIEPDR